MFLCTWGGGSVCLRTGIGTGGAISAVNSEHQDPQYPGTCVCLKEFKHSLLQAGFGACS